MKYILCILTLIFSINAFSGGHDLTELKGTDIDLKLYDHAFAGSIKDFVVFGYKKEGKFESKLQLKKDGKMVEAIFSKNRDGIGGVIRHESEGRNIVSNLKLVKINQEEQSIEISHNGKNIRVDIEGDDYRNNHFINPRYEANIDGKLVKFNIKDGEACYGFSTHLIFMILGAYLH